MSVWEFPTLRADRAQAGLTGEALATPVRCPGLPGRRCHRLASPAMMRKVAPAPASVTGGAAYLCDACVELLHREERLGRAELATLLGAPASEVARLLARAVGNPLLGGLRGP